MSATTPRPVLARLRRPRGPIGRVRSIGAVAGQRTPGPAAFSQPRQPARPRSRLRGASPGCRLRIGAPYGAAGDAARLTPYGGSGPGWCCRPEATPRLPRARPAAPSASSDWSISADRRRAGRRQLHRASIWLSGDDGFGGTRRTSTSTTCTTLVTDALADARPGSTSTGSAGRCSPRSLVFALLGNLPTGSHPLWRVLGHRDRLRPASAVTFFAIYNDGIVPAAT